ncbi:hypothetical protein EFT87_13910 [Schleiferilactobacillus harbinensis]|uniref:S41 family peptidase n=1 Tax=Schleiferilactobacillus harbinensis TaxID=304207 RepID=UPI0021A5EAC4|nr:S41 family peptidase [Schleiferilactobacillus harbinensis]MCT2909742.1 hypothetical protein [Schleiferilactobacillus harbinensis]
MKNQVKITLCFAALVLLFSIFPSANAAITSIQDDAVETVAYMSQHGIIEDKTAWQEVVDKTDAGRTITTIADLNAVMQVGNKHSSAAKRDASIRHEQLPGAYRAGRLTVVDIPTFYTMRQSVYLRYIVKLNQLIAHTRGDLVLNFSGNQGGIPTAMIFGLYALIPNGQLWTSVANTGKEQQVSLVKDGLQGGAASYRSTVVKRVLEKVKKRLNKKVAIIMDNNSASAAEFTIMAVKKNPLARIFGLPSAGYTTENSNVTYHSPICDNSWQIIPWMVTRTDHTVRCINVVNARQTHNFSNTPVMPDVLFTQPINTGGANAHHSQISKSLLSQIRKWFDS